MLAEMVKRCLVSVIVIVYSDSCAPLVSSSSLYRRIEEFCPLIYARKYRK